MEQSQEQILAILKNIAKEKLELDFDDVDVNMK